MKENIFEKRTKGLYSCKLCPNSEFSFKYIRKHLLSSNHKNRVFDNQDFEKLMNVLMKEKEESTTDEKKDTEDYLAFINLCASLSLSIRQISKLAKGLKNLYFPSKLRFLQKNDFDESNISIAINSFGDYCLEKLKEDLSNSKYSLAIDNSTISKTSICAIKVKYLKERRETSENSANQKIEIQNKIIGLKYLKDSSSGETLFKAIKEKVFDLNEEVKNNFIGITFDHAKAMTGNRIGLISHLRKEFGRKFIFDLEDPCHSFNLAIKHSLDSLPKDITKFIDDLHHHFSSTQRTAKLLMIQEEMEVPQKGLCYYVSTRWLSLGSSLDRILEIWESLKKYMELKPKSSSLKKFNSEKYLKLMLNPIFKLKLTFLNAVFKRINLSNIKLQAQTLEIHELYCEMNNCVKGLAEILLNYNLIPQNLRELADLPWDKENFESEFMREDADFIKQLGLELDKSLFNIHTVTGNQKKELINFCRDYFKKIISLLLTHLHYDATGIETFEFVTFPLYLEELKTKVLEFNKMFQVVQSEQELIQEINNFYNKKLDWARCSSSLQFWSRIESAFTCEDNGASSFPNLSALVRTAHCLPTSSACVEQSFSILKLCKSPIRNRLKERTIQSLLFIKDENKKDSKMEITERLLEIFTQNKELKNKKISISLDESKFKGLEETKEIEQGNESQVILTEKTGILQEESKLISNSFKTSKRKENPFDNNNFSYQLKNLKASSDFEDNLDEDIKEEEWNSFILDDKLQENYLSGSIHEEML